MVDSRFFNLKTKTILHDLLTQCEIVSSYENTHAGDQIVQGLGTVPFLDQGIIGFVSDRSYADTLGSLDAGIVIIPEGLMPEVIPSVTLVEVDRPYEAFVRVAQYLYGSNLSVGNYSELLALRSETTCIGENCRIGPNVTCGQDVELGSNVTIGANSVLGRGVTVGNDSVIADNVSIYASHIGNSCVVHSGARIGGDGFGFIPGADEPIRIPQLGRVIIQDGVEVGTNSCIDRGMLDDTVIGENTKIDNQVQIAHNVVIGRNCQISAQTGIAGSSVIGDNVLLGGRVGIVNKARIGDYAKVMACSLVTKDVMDGASVAGNPAIDIKKWRKEIVSLRRVARKES